MKYHNWETIKEMMEWVISADDEDKRTILMALEETTMTEWWRYIAAHLDKKIELYKSILCGEKPELIKKEMSEHVFNSYDLMRVDRNALKEIIDLPSVLQKLNEKAQIVDVESEI